MAPGRPPLDLVAADARSALPVHAVPGRHGNLTPPLLSAQRLWGTGQMEAGQVAAYAAKV